LKERINIFWFRRDLRLDDNTGLHHALHAGLPVLPLFVFDTHILDRLDDKDDRRVSFIYQALQNMQTTLQAYGASLKVMHGLTADAMETLANSFDIAGIYTNHDYEPYAQKRDGYIADWCRSQGIGFFTFKDQVIFEKSEVVKDDGKPYTVFTPYAKKWRAKLDDAALQQHHSAAAYDAFLKQQFRFPSLASLGFQLNETYLPSGRAQQALIKDYEANRDFPGIDKTTHLGVHLRFGTVSIRKLAAEALLLNETFLKELVWREFFMQILWHFPGVVSNSFKPKYDAIQWRNNEKEFEHWCAGTTGYPIVDAGMRQLNETGFMHNRVRMITANFLTRILLVDWRWGEAYFAHKLLDFELSSNNGNWQWAAGCGCDAAPYFRIFNPEAQQLKFDPNYDYVRQWIPGYDPATYIKPITDFSTARQRALDTYKKALA
jgi:deoxyribodipyrimidine photo-lyase